MNLSIAFDQTNFLQPFDADKALYFQISLLEWFSSNGRHNLPWKPQVHYSLQTNLYHIWLSEIMLQQTQVTTVIPYFKAFIQHFPTIKDLAYAHQDEVMKLWEGLGYYSRAKHLHATAKIIVDHYSSMIPNDINALLALKGIGRTTAAAILSQGYNEPFAILEGNVKRVLSRILGCASPKKQLDKQLQPFADYIVSKERPADYTQAIMDFGATLCKRTPKCELCFFAQHCIAIKMNLVSKLPTPHPKLIKPEIARYFLIFTNPKNEILSVKREAKGLWANLYSLPEMDHESNVVDWLHEQNISYQSFEALTKFIHKFSHYVLHGYPVIIQIHNEETVLNYFKNSSFVTISALKQLPKPKPIVDLFKNLQ